MIRVSISRRVGFSLIELLTVMAVVGVLATLTVAAVRGIGGANSLTAAGNQIAALAFQARQHSMTRGACTALIISEDIGAQAVYALTPRSDGDAPETADWTQLTRWTTLPAGIAIDWAASSLASQSAALTPPLPALTRAGQTVAGYRMLVFKPDGSLLGETDPPGLRVVEGQVDSNGGLVRSHPGSSNGSANVYDIRFLPASGRIKIDRN